MIFKTLVECLLKKYHDPDDRLALNALTTLTQEIQRDLTQAFVLSRPLVDRYASVFWESKSYFDFLMKISHLPSLQDLSASRKPSPRPDPPDAGSPPPTEPGLAWERIRDQERLEQQLGSCQRQLEGLASERETWIREKEQLRKRLASCQAELEDCESQRTQSVNVWKSHCDTAEGRAKSLEKELRACRERLDTLQSENTAWHEKAHPESAHTLAFQDSVLQQRNRDIAHLEQKLEQCLQYINPLHAYMQQLYLENWKLLRFVDSLQIERDQILTLGNQLWSEYTDLRSRFDSRRATYREIEAKTALLQEAGVTVTLDADVQDQLVGLSTESRDDATPCGKRRLSIAETPMAPEEGQLLRTFQEQLAHIQTHFEAVQVDRLAEYVTHLHRRLDACRSDLLAEVAKAVPVESASVDWIVERLREWKSLRERTGPGCAEPVAHIQKCLQVYDTLTQSIPHLQTEGAAQQLGNAWTALRHILRAQNIERLKIEEDTWFETFVRSYVGPMLHFIKKLEKMEPTIQMAYMTHDWYEAFKEKFHYLKSEEKSNTSKDKRKSDANTSGKGKKKQKVDVGPLYCKHVNHLQMVTLENLFHQLYEEHFKLKLRHYQNVSWTPDEKEKIKSKLKILSEGSQRPNSQLKIYGKYIEFDLNTAIGNLKSIQEIMETNDFLVACMESTTKYLEQHFKTR